MNTNYRVDIIIVKTLFLLCEYYFLPHHEWENLDTESLYYVNKVVWWVQGKYNFCVCNSLYYMKPQG